MVTARKNAPLFFYWGPGVTNYLWDVGVIHASEQLGFVQPQPPHLSQASHQQRWGNWCLQTQCDQSTSLPIHLCPSFPTNYSGFKWTRQLQLWRLTPTKPSHTIPDHLNARKKIKTAVKTFYQISEKQKERTYFDLLFSSNTHSHLSFCREKKKRDYSPLQWNCIEAA